MATPTSAFKHSAKPKPGKGAAGSAYDPLTPPPAAAAAAAAHDEVASLDRPRPATTRYPISREDFAALEAAAVTVKVKAKKGVTLVPDKAHKQELAAQPAVAMPSAPAFTPPSAAPTTLGNFAGLTDTGWFPPDCTAAVGPDHVVVAANASFAVYSKAGAVARAPQTFASWFSNVLTAAKIFDPKVIFDQFTGRWFLVTVALPSDPAVKGSYFLLSVSQTSDPLGPWWNYKLDATKDGGTATTNWADYPGLGVDAQALYLTANMFKFGGSFQYAKVRILDKTPLLTGATATWFDFTKLKNGDGSTAFTVQPCHTFGAPQVQYLVSSYFTSASTQDKLTLWSIAGPPAAPALTGLTVDTAPYGQPPVADQKGGAPGLNAGDVRVLNAVFRGGSVWCALTTFHNWDEAVNRAAVHWFQINATSGAIVQQGVFGAKGVHYYYPALMPDTNGNMTLVFCRSGANEYASIYLSGRAAADPLGKLQSSVLLKAGGGNSQRVDGSGRNRWGDYAGIAVDPQDGRNVWVYSMFADANNKWGTWVGVARF
ncbi:MAG: hypothetical protein ACRC33_01385 [Gemmataceae bacterium]